MCLVFRVLNPTHETWRGGFFRSSSLFFVGSSSLKERRTNSFRGASWGCPLLPFFSWWWWSIIFGDDRNLHHWEYYSCDECIALCGIVVVDVLDRRRRTFIKRRRRESSGVRGRARSARAQRRDGFASVRTRRRARPSVLLPPALVHRRELSDVPRRSGKEPETRCDDDGAFLSRRLFYARGARRQRPSDDDDEETTRLCCRGRRRRRRRRAFFFLSLSLVFASARFCFVVCCC